MKLFRSLFFLFLISLGMQPAFARFVDVPVSHPNYDAINYMQLEEFVKGYADGNFNHGLDHHLPVPLGALLAASHRALIFPPLILPAPLPKSYLR